MSAQDDDRHVQLLSIFHYVLAGMLAVLGCFPIIHLVIGITMLVSPQSFAEMEQANGPAGQEFPAQLFGLLFTLLAAAMILLAWAAAGAVFFAGRYLARRTHYTYCLVVAGISCIFMPVGTVLGVFTILVLTRESVRASFEGQAPAAALEP